MTLTEKAAYIKGLVEGLGLNDDSKEGKVYAAILDLLDDLALSCEDNECAIDELYELADEIDQDLGAVEEEVYDICDCDDDDCDCCGDDEYAVICPNCDEEIGIDIDTIMNEETITCPNCGEILELETDCDCDDCNDED